MSSLHRTDRSDLITEMDMHLRKLVFMVYQLRRGMNNLETEQSQKTVTRPNPWEILLRPLNHPALQIPDGNAILPQFFCNPAAPIARPADGIDLLPAQHCCYRFWLS